MTKVYVVKWNYSEGGYNGASGILHIFKTKEAAENFIKCSNRHIDEDDLPNSLEEWDVLD